MATAGQLEALPQWDLRRIAWVDPRPGLGPAQRAHHADTFLAALVPLAYGRRVAPAGATSRPTPSFGAGPRPNNDSWMAACRIDRSVSRRFRRPAGRRSLLDVELLEREAALADLDALAAARRGRGRVVLVGGGAGMGKTSVVQRSWPGWTPVSPSWRAPVTTC